MLIAILGTSDRKTTWNLWLQLPSWWLYGSEGSNIVNAQVHGDEWWFLIVVAGESLISYDFMVQFSCKWMGWLLNLVSCFYEPGDAFSASVPPARHLCQAAVGVVYRCRQCLKLYPQIFASSVFLHSTLREFSTRGLCFIARPQRAARSANSCYGRWSWLLFYASGSTKARECVILIRREIICKWIYNNHMYINVIYGI